MFVVKVYCKIEFTVNFHHEHFIDPTNCPWVSEDGCSSKANWSKGYEIFRVALSVVENNEDRRVSLVIHYRLVQNLWSRRVLWWRNDHTRVALTILPDQDPSKVHEATAGSSPCVRNWVGCISGKIHAASQGSSYVKKANKQRNS